MQRLSGQLRHQKTGSKHLILYSAFDIPFSKYSFIYTIMTLSDDKYVSLESVFCPGQYVVVDENGEVQSPVETPATHRSSLFIPFPHSTPTVSDVIVTRATHLCTNLPDVVIFVC